MKTFKEIFTEKLKQHYALMTDAESKITGVALVAFDEYVSQVRKQPEPSKTADEVLDLNRFFEGLRNDPNHHLGLGDVRLTISQQDVIIYNQSIAAQSHPSDAIEFADWKDNLTPAQKVSVWSKNGEHRNGLYNMDNEQLYEKFLQEKKGETNG
jgi:hypothetical protein